MGEGKTKRPLKREFSAGGIVYKKLKVNNPLRGKNEKLKVLWLIIKPAETDRWQLPKGKIDAGESSEKTAIREVEEEGGIKAKVIQKIGSEQFFFFFKGNRIFKTVTFYLMEYVSGNPKNHDEEVSESVFFDFDEALNKLTFKNEKEILKKAKEILERPIQGDLI